jgi:hypothetical protein
MNSFLAPYSFGESATTVISEFSAKSTLKGHEGGTAALFNLVAKCVGA